MALSLPLFPKKIQVISWDKLLEVYREPIVTYCITPNNSPVKNTERTSPFKKGKGRQGKFLSDEFGFEDVYEDSIASDMLLNTITGLFSKFYLPERIRFSRSGVKIRMNDVVSYKVVFQNGTMKFYLSIPERWAKNFTNAIKRDWGQVDITKVSEEIIKFNPEKAKAMNIVLRNHHCLAIKHERDGRDNFYPSLSSLGSTMTKDDKLILDFNITPLANSWKDDAIREFHKAKKGKLVLRKETSLASIANIVLTFANTLMDEATRFINDLMMIEDEAEDKIAKEELKFNYTNEKLHPNANGYQVQIKAVAESNDAKKTRHLLKGVQNTCELLNGDNQFVVKHVRTKRGVKAVIECIEQNKPMVGYGKDIFCEKEMNQLIKVPSKQTLKEFKKVIDQDNFTRTEIHADFFKNEVGALPFAKTLDKDSKLLFMPTYEREDWTDKGRKALVKTKIDDRCTETLVFGKKGSGKTELSVRQALATFLAGMPTITYEKWKQTAISNLTKDEWEDMMYDEWKKKSKSVFAFDVADGEILTKIWNSIPTWLKKRQRVIILNHAVPSRPVPVNFAELEEFNRVTLKDPDYSYRLAEMEADLISEVLEVDKSMLVERWFKYALQAVHYASPDWGIPEAIKMLVDDDFRINEVQPLISVDAELLLEMQAYNKLCANGEAGKVISPIQNRLAQIKAERKLWDCIAQKPLRDEEGKSVINFRKWADGDEDGAYMVMVYIPDASKKFRRFLFAHYFIKIWSVAKSREKGFAGREYRPETLVIIDEIHQIIDVSIVSKIFIDLFKEVRKYSFRFWFTLHGWSSFSKAGRTLENDLKEAIIEMGANLIMLKGGEDAFDSLDQFMGEMTSEDYKNLMNMEFCGIFSILWDNARHVFQGRMLQTVEKDKDVVTKFKQYDKWDLYDLADYVSPYSRNQIDVRSENLERIKNMVTDSIINEGKESGKQMAKGVKWEDVGEDVS